VLLAQHRQSAATCRKPAAIWSSPYRYSRDRQDIGIWIGRRSKAPRTGGSFRGPAQKKDYSQRKPLAFRRCAVYGDQMKLQAVRMTTKHKCLSRPAKEDRQKTVPTSVAKQPFSRSNGGAADDLEHIMAVAGSAAEETSAQIFGALTQLLEAKPVFRSRSRRPGCEKIAKQRDLLLRKVGLRR